MAEGAPVVLNICRKKTYQNGHEQWCTLGKVKFFGGTPESVVEKLCENGIQIDLFNMEGTCVALPYKRKEDSEKG